MSDDPIRWVDDPEASSALREDLSLTAGLESAGYSTAAGLARLEAAKAGSIALKPLAWWIIGGTTAVAIGIAAWRLGSSAPVSSVPTSPEPTQMALVTAVPDLPSPALSSAVIPATVVVVPPKPSVAVVPKAPDPDAVQAELAQLARIRQLSKTDPSSALAGAADGDHQFPKGPLHQEREVVAIDSLSKLGRRDEARARAQAFLASFPHSPYAEQVASASQ